MDCGCRPWGFAVTFGAPKQAEMYGVMPVRSIREKGEQG